MGTFGSGKYSFVKRLGQGAYGSVVKAKDLENDRFVAIKQIALKGDVAAQLRVFREVQSLRHCDHSNIIRLLDVLWSPAANGGDYQRHSDDASGDMRQHQKQPPMFVSLVLELVESSLRLVIDDERRPLLELIPRHYFTQILYGIAYLHEHNSIMHRALQQGGGSIKIIKKLKDLKPDNILVTAQNRVRIADFGLACIYFPANSERTYEHQVVPSHTLIHFSFSFLIKMFENSRSRTISGTRNLSTNSQVATRWYRAPELLFGATRYTPAVDLWALGCIFAEFFNGEPLFGAKTDIEQLTRVFTVMGTPTEHSWPGWEVLPDASKVMFDPVEPTDDWTQIVPSVSPEGLRLIRALIQLNPVDRFSALRSLQLPFFTQHPQYDAIPYQPPMLEANIGRRQPEIVFTEASKKTLKLKSK